MPGVTVGMETISFVSTFYTAGKMFAMFYEKSNRSVKCRIKSFSKNYKMY